MKNAKAYLKEKGMINTVSTNSKRVSAFSCSFIFILGTGIRSAVQKSDNGLFVQASPSQNNIYCLQYFFHILKNLKKI